MQPSRGRWPSARRCATGSLHCRHPSGDAANQTQHNPAGPWPLSRCAYPYRHSTRPGFRSIPRRCCASGVCFAYTDRCAFSRCQVMPIRVQRAELPGGNISNRAAAMQFRAQQLLRLRFFPGFLARLPTCSFQLHQFTIDPSDLCQSKIYTPDRRWHFHPGKCVIWHCRILKEIQKKLNSPREDFHSSCNDYCAPAAAILLLTRRPLMARRFSAGFCYVRVMVLLEVGGSSTSTEVLGTASDLYFGWQCVACHGCGI